MRQNKRKNRTDGAFPKRLVLVVVAAVSVILVYICVQNRMDEMGREIKKLEADHDRLRAKFIKEQCEWARMQSPANIERALREHGLVMTWPSRDQIVRIRPGGWIEPAQRTEPRTRGQYARVDRIVMND
jgi:hypothetical protein